MSLACAKMGHQRKAEEGKAGGLDSNPNARTFSKSSGIPFVKTEKKCSVWLTAIIIFAPQPQTNLPPKSNIQLDVNLKRKVRGKPSK